MDEQIDRLSEMLCFDLYAASRTVTAAYRPVLERHGLTYPQYLVLTVLWSRGSCNIRYLADRLRLDHATLSPLLRRMEDTDLVHRSRSASDERVVVVQPTPRALRLAEDADDIQCHISEALGLSTEQLATLQDLLHTVERNARAAGSAAASRSAG